MTTNKKPQTKNRKQKTRIPLLLCYVLICLLFSQQAHAQFDTASHPFFPAFLSDTKSFFNDAGTFFSAPAYFSQNDWILTGAVIGGTVALFTIDNNVRSLAQRNQNSTLNNFADVSRIYGEYYFGAGVSVGIYGAGLFTKDKELRTAGVMIFEAVAFSAAITQTIKFFSGRSRPFTHDGTHTFSPFTFREEHVSLPSGHSTAAFALSSVLAAKFNNTYASIGLYSLATLTALSRVYNDDHWTSDIVLGSVIGYVSGTAVAHLHDSDSETSAIHVTPIINGIQVELRF